MLQVGGKDAKTFIEEILRRCFDADVRASMNVKGLQRGSKEEDSDKHKLGLAKFRFGKALISKFVNVIVILHGIQQTVNSCPQIQITMKTHIRYHFHGEESFMFTTSPTSTQ